MSNEEIQESDFKLTAKMKKVIHDLNNGYVLVTSNSISFAIVAGGQGQEDYTLRGDVFWKMVNGGVLWQNNGRYGHSNYELTQNYKK